MGKCRANVVIDYKRMRDRYEQLGEEEEGLAFMGIAEVVWKEVG